MTLIEPETGQLIEAIVTKTDSSAIVERHGTEPSEWVAVSGDFRSDPKGTPRDAVFDLWAKLHP